MSDDKVINFLEKRSEVIEKKRRSIERIMFNNFLGCYSVIHDDQGSIFAVNLVDISRSGCLFQVPVNANNDEQFKKGTELKLRMYFTKNSFIPVVVRIKYGKEFKEKDGTTYVRYGCEFDKSYKTFEAFESFIDFIYKFAEHSAIDKGDTKVYFL